MTDPLSGPSSRPPDRRPEFLRTTRRSVSRWLSIFVAGLLVALTLTPLTGTTWAATTYRVLALTATVSGTSVKASATVSASTTTFASFYSVCVRDADGRNFDFPARADVAITSTGTRYSGTRTLPPGIYDYGACLKVAGKWIHAGGWKPVVVASAEPRIGKAPPLEAPNQWSMVFEDDFLGSSLDRTKWRPNRFGGGSSSKDGPFNPSIEAAYFTSSNVTVGGGRLALTLRKSSAAVGGKTYPYSSGTVSTQGKFTFGDRSYVEARVWIPVGTGLWPAFWAVPEGRWPPEIDGFEFFNTHTQKRPAFNYHWLDEKSIKRQSGPSNFGDASVDYRGSWHTYGIERRGGAITPWLDGVRYPAVAASTADTSAMFIILNLSVKAGKQPAAGAQFLTDYVRCWKYTG